MGNLIGHYRIRHVPSGAQTNGPRTVPVGKDTPLYKHLPYAVEDTRNTIKATYKFSGVIPWRPGAEALGRLQRWG
jgi:hypothetical protein